MEDVVKNIQKPRGYCEPPAKPTFFDASLRMIGGDNPLGQSYLRVVWGWDARLFRNEDPNALAYPGPFLDRWILEKWLPAEFFGTPEEWEKCRYFQSADGKRIDSLGPYPRQGRYGMVMPLVAAGLSGTTEGDFIPLGEEVLTFVEILLPTIRFQTPDAYQSAENYRKLQEQMADEESKRWEEAEQYADILGDELKGHRGDHEDRNPAFSLPGKSLWTPEGEHQIH
jgi:hypothetical protein